MNGRKSKKCLNSSKSSDSRGLKGCISKRLFSQSGETLTEVLASVLIISLGMTMFVSAFLSSSRMLTQGEDQMQVYYMGRNEVEAGRTPAGKTGGTGQKEAFELELQMPNGSVANLASKPGTSGTSGVSTGRYSISLYQGTITEAGNTAKNQTGTGRGTGTAAGTGTSGTGTGTGTGTATGTGTGTSGTGTGTAAGTGTSDTSSGRKLFRYQLK